MKRRSIRLLSMLLALAVLCAAMPLSVLAEDRETEVPIPETVSEPRSETLSPEHTDMPEADVSVHTFSDVNYHDTIEDVAAELRAEIKERNRMIDVGLRSTQKLDKDALCSQVLQTAIAHNGVPTEGDYLSNAWRSMFSYGEEEMQDGVHYYTLTYMPDYFTTAEQERQVDAAVAELLQELDLWNKSDYQKIRGVYNWICDNVDYDYDNLQDYSYLLKHSAYAALIHRKAVCQGYAVLLYRLLLELGIDCRVISGYSGDERHAWNIIGLEGKYYNADPTWDEGLSVFPRYFLCTENNFPDHTRDSEFDTPAFHAAHPMAETPYVQKVAASGTLENGMTWVLDGDTGMLTISGKGPMPDFDNQRAPWFPYADNISGITIGEGITYVGEYSFGRCKNATTAYLPTTVTGIGAYAFNNCRSLKAITLHEGITAIGSSAFAECTSLMELTLPSTITSYGSGIFSHCHSLTRLTFAENTTYIPGVFYNCDSLSQISIPETVTEIDGGAFMDCDALKEVYLPASVATLGIGVFSSCNSLKKITVAEDNPSYASVDGVLFSKDLTVLHCYPAGRSGTYAIPDGTVTLAKNSFREALRLTNVTFPDSVKTIADYAFFNCHGLTDVVIGEGVESIGNYGLGYCDNLRTIHLGSSIKKLEGAFRYFSMSGTSGLEAVYFTGDAPKMDKYTFYLDIEVTCYYPAGNRTWTEDMKQNYGGIVTWVPYGSCDGEHSYETEVFPATCDKRGYTEYFCTVCGDCYQDHFVDPLGHSYEEDHSSEATCWSPAYTMYWCTVCGNSYMEEWGEPVPHSYEVSVFPATCYMGGYTEHWCVFCGDFYMDGFTDPVDHSYDRMVTEATCMEPGFTYYFCIFCNEGYMDDWVDPVGHSYSVIVTEPSCLEGGYTEYYCVCGDWYMDDFTDPLGHHYESEITPPTYEEQGYTTHTCTNCGDWYVTDYMDALIRYDVLEGNDTEWSGESELPIAVRVAADIARFVKVLLNGEVVAPDHYTVTEGSTIVTLKREYLATLPSGAYTLEIVFADGIAEATFHVTDSVVLGDVDGNGEVDTTDAYLIVMYYNERMELDEAQLLAADADGSGEVDTTDAYYIVMYYNERIDKLPAEE